MGTGICAQGQRPGDTDLLDLNIQEFGGMFGYDPDVVGGLLFVRLLDYSLQGVAGGKRTDQIRYRDQRFVAAVDRSGHLPLSRINLLISLQLERIELIQGLVIHNLLGDILIELAKDIFLRIIRPRIVIVPGNKDYMGKQVPLLTRFLELMIISLGEDHSSIVSQKVSSIPKIHALIHRFQKAVEFWVLLHLVNSLIHVIQYSLNNNSAPQPLSPLRHKGRNLMLCYSSFLF